MSQSKIIKDALQKMSEARQHPQGGNLDEIFGLDLGGERSVRHYKQVIPVSLHHFYITEDIKEVSYYLNMINVIKTAEQHDTIFLYLNSNGGNLHTAIQIMSAIRQSSATVITVMEGMVASAATMIFLVGHKHIVNPNCTFMIHNYSHGLMGKGNEVAAQVIYTEDFFRELAEAVYGGFLTEDEINSVISGKDLWMGSKEVTSRVKSKLIVQNEPEDIAEIIKTLQAQQKEDVKVSAVPDKPAKPVKPKTSRKLPSKVVKKVEKASKV